MSTDERPSGAPTYTSPPVCRSSQAHSLPQTLARRHFTLQSDRPADLAEVDLSAVDPYLRTLLFTDGTVTRTLEAQSLSPVSVEVISQEQTFARGPVARHLAMSSGLGAVRRRVRIGMGEPAAPVIWAESHIVPGRLPDDFFNVLGDVGDGIGESLQQVQLESWREMLWFGFGSIPDWSGVSTASEPTAITRLYRVIVGGRPALLISEMFAVRQLAGMYHLGAFIDHTEPNSSSMS